MTRQQATAVRKAIKATGAPCKMMRIGAGKHVEIGLHGRASEAIAVALEAKGYTRSLITGRGTDYMDPIVMDKAA